MSVQWCGGGANLLFSIATLHAAFFLCRLLMRKISEQGEHVYLECIRRKVELEYVIVFWSSMYAY